MGKKSLQAIIDEAEAGAYIDLLDEENLKYIGVSESDGILKVEEPIKIKKSITISGESMKREGKKVCYTSGVTLVGNKRSEGIVINADDVTIRGFTLAGFKKGVYVNKSKDVTLERLLLGNNGQDIRVEDSKNVNILDCEISDKLVKKLV